MTAYGIPSFSYVRVNKNLCVKRSLIFGLVNNESPSNLVTRSTFWKKTRSLGKGIKSNCMYELQLVLSSDLDLTDTPVNIGKET